MSFFILAVAGGGVFVVSQQRAFKPEATLLSSPLLDFKGGGLDEGSPFGGSRARSQAPSAAASPSVNLVTVPLLNLDWEKVVTKEGTKYKNGDFVIRENDTLQLAPNSVNSANIAHHTIRSEDIHDGAITSRTIENHTIQGQDVNPETTLTIGSLTVTGTTTFQGAQTASGDLDMQGNIIMNIGDTGTDFTSTGGLNLAGALDVNSLFYVNIAGDLTEIKGLSYSWPSTHTTGGVLQNDGTGTLVWQTLGAASVTPDSLDFSEFKDALTLDASTDIALGALTLSTSGTGAVSFNNTGIFTVAGNIDFNGTSNDIAGTLNLSGNALTSSSALIITPAAGNNLNIALSTTGDFAVNTNQLYVDTSTGNVGIGQANPTAVLHLKAGTATANTAPLKFTSGALLTTPEAGAVEFLTDKFYGTITTGAARQTFATLESSAQTFSSDISVPDEAYGVAWNASLEVPTKNAVYDKLELFAAGTGIDHGGLTGLADDDHTQYALLAGRAGGQILKGGTGTTDDLTLQTTSGIGATGADMHFLVGNAGATEAITILNNGNVGIGTTSPGYRLDVQGGNTRIQGQQYLQETAARVGVWLLNPADNVFQVARGSDNMNLLYVNSNGNVGIGTTAPGDKLDVNGGNAQFSSLGKGLRFMPTGVDYNMIRGYTAEYETGLAFGTRYPLIFQTVTTGAFEFIDQAGNSLAAIKGTTGQAYFKGNVGIGTTSPLARLGVVGADSLSTSFAANISGATGTGLVITNAGNVGIGTTGPGAKLDVNGAIKLSGTDNIILNGNWLSGDGGDEGVFVSTTGNVGIGTTAPNDKLEISGNLRFTGANPHITASSYFIAPGGAYFNSGTVYTKAQIQARGGIADDGGVLELNDDVNIGAGDLYVVNSSGNVGIGTTTPGGKLEVVGNTILDMYVKLRDYDDDTLNTELISRDSSWMFWNGGIVAGQYANGAVPSGFGGTGTLLTMGQTALAVSSGNVGIGTTGPATKLELQGSSAPIARLGVSSGLLNSKIGAIEFRNASDVYLSKIESYASDPTYSDQTDLRFFTTYQTSQERVRITSNGNVGIGTTAPSAKLEVVGNIKASGDLYGTSLGQIFHTTNTSTLYAGQYTKIATITITSQYQNYDGNVSIIFQGSGETFIRSADLNIRVKQQAAFGSNPYVDLRVTNSKSIPGSWFAYKIVSNVGPTVVDIYAVPNASYTNLTGSVLLNDNSSIITWYSDQSFSASITGAVAANNVIYENTSNNYVGIGTTGPGAKLDVLSTNVVTNTTGNLYVHTSNAQAINLGGQISLGGSYNDAGGQNPFGAIAGRKDGGVTGVASGYLALSTSIAAGGALTEKMRIDSNGNVGIGDTTPSALLTVGNGDLFQVNSSGAIAAAAGITSSGSITFSGLSAGGVVSAASGTGVLSVGTLGASSITADTLDFTEFKDALTLDAATDIALGALTLSTSGTGAVSFNNTGTFTVAGNIDFNGTGTNDIAGTLNLSGNALTSSGALTVTPAAGSNLNIALSTTGDFVVNGSQLYVDTSTGYVGIGTTGPDAKLDSLATTQQLRLTYTDGTVYSGFTVDSSGNLTIDNTGTKTTIADDLSITGGDILNNTLTLGDATVANNLVFSNPGIGNFSTLKFTKTNDNARIEVKEVSSDITSFVFHMDDNPDSSSDKFYWENTSWTSPGHDWQPLLLSNLDATIKASDINLYGAVNVTSPYYTGTLGALSTVDMIKTGTLTMTPNVSAYTGDTTPYCITIDGVGSPNTFKWKSGALGCSSNTSWAATAVPITGAAQTLNNGVTITFSGTTGGALTDRYAFRANKGGTVTSPYLIGGTSTTSDLYLKTTTGVGTTGADMHFLVGNNGATEAMTILNNGNVGIGTTNPGAKLNVIADSVSDYATELFNDGNATTRWGLLVQAGLDDQTAADPSTLVQFNDGDGTAVGSITFGSSVTNYNTSSDVRLKQNIADSSLGLDDLMRIQVRDYTWRADETNRIAHGFIAQELYNIYPDAVTVPKDDRFWMVDYSKLTPLIVKSIQDQQGEITQQQGTLDTISLQTTANITTVSELQTSVDSELLVVSGSINTLKDGLATQEDALKALKKAFTEQSDRITAIEAQSSDTPWQSSFDTLSSHVTLLDSKMETFTDQVVSLADFYATFELGNLIAKDSDGNVDLLDGKLRARSVRSDEGVFQKITIETGSDADVIVGKNTIQTGETKVTIETTAVEKDSNILITPRSAFDGSLAVTDVVDGISFTVETAKLTDKDIPFTWLIVGQKEAK